MRGEKFRFAVGFGNTMGKRKSEVLGEELLNVWALDIVGFLDLNHFEDLHRESDQHVK